jgi:hypothetical protein
VAVVEVADVEAAVAEVSEFARARDRVARERRRRLAAESNEKTRCRAALAAALDVARAAPPQ